MESQTFYFQAVSEQRKHILTEILELENNFIFTCVDTTYVSWSDLRFSNLLHIQKAACTLQLSVCLL